MVLLQNIFKKEEFEFMKWTNKGHQFDDLGNLLRNKKRVYIYGAAQLGKNLFDLLNQCNAWLHWDICFVDANPDKQKCGYYGVKVLSPEEFFSLSAEEHFVVITASPANTAEITLNLMKAGYLPDVTVFPFEKFVNFYLPIHSIYQHDIVFVSSQNVIPSTVCNLNCRSCLNFNPYIKQHITDSLSELKKDIDTFFSVVDFIYRFQISGGEPFMFSGLADLIKYIGENYRHKIHKFETVTNGTVVPSDKMCHYFKKYNVHIFLDDYRKAIKNDDKYNIVQEKLKINRIEYTNNYVEKWFDLAPLTTDHSMWSDEQLMNYFNKCANPWSNLRRQKISSCNYAHYAAKAGINSDYSDEYFDLTKITADNKKEFIEFRLGYNEKGYVNFCKKCAGFSTINTNIVEAGEQASKRTR